MSEDTFPPPDPFPAPEEEELEAANALRQALEGRPAGSRVPEEALETAAFLRHAGDGGRLSSERRAQLRAELLASLPAAPLRAPRRSWRSWLGIGITLLGAASAAVTVGVLGVREWSSQDRAHEARSAAMETAAYGDEGSAAPRGTAAAPEPELAPAPAPAEQAASLAVASGDAPTVGEGALGGLGDMEPRAPARAEQRRSAMMAPAPATAPTSAGPLADRAAKRTQSSEAPGAFASKAAPADESEALGAGTGLGSAESKGGRAASSPPAGAVARAAANAASPAKELDTEARIARQRQDQRRRLLARLADTPAPGAYRDADSARSVSELERARERLTALSTAGLGGTSSTAEAEQLRPDVYCRLAEIALRLAQPHAALDWVRQGLALGGQPSPFVACLYQQQGRAREALGDRDGAAQSYMNALKVNEQLLNESLEAP